MLMAGMRGAASTGPYQLQVHAYPLFLCLCFAAPALADVPAGHLSSAQLAIVINDDDPNSVIVGEYYRTARDIPQVNIVHVRIPDKPRKLSAVQFADLKQQIDSKLGPEIQALLMVWTAPYAVECNSITAAYTLGFNAEQCAPGCVLGKTSPYFNSPSQRPYADYGMRLSMLLPTDSIVLAKAVVDRGTSAGFRNQPATAYFLSTSDAARNTRAPLFPPTGQVNKIQLKVKTMDSDVLADAKDVIIYETGMIRVGKLETLRFMPGALADHLTSFGGDLLGQGQMSSLRWLEAGATASYGTVSEPCNYWQKFPLPKTLLIAYATGATAIEAYWKSVAWPAQGLFIGEPLALPYPRQVR